MVRVVLEQKIDAHAASLYSHEGGFAEGLAGWGSLDAAALELFSNQGYLLIRGALSDEEVDRAVGDLDRLIHDDEPPVESVYYEAALAEVLQTNSGDEEEGVEHGVEETDGAGHPGHRYAIGTTVDAIPQMDCEVRASFVRKVMGFATPHYPHLHHIAQLPALLEAVASLQQVGKPGVTAPRLFQDMAMIKPPGGREKPWHQDHAYFNLPLDTPIVGVWIALGRVTPANGAMVVLPGGHKEGPRLHFQRRDFQLCDAEVDQMEPRVAVRMEAGDVLLFDGKLPHGTPTNTTDEKRWGLQLHYIPSDVTLFETNDIRLAAFGSEGKDATC